MQKKIFSFFLFGLAFVIKCNAQVITDPLIEFVESIPVETTLDNPGIRNTSEVWKEMIGKAASKIDIEQFYISNQEGEKLEEIISGISNAAERGVLVRIIVDKRMYATYPETVDKLGKTKGISVRIIDFSKMTKGIQHAKYFIIDGEEIFFGSQNFDWRALTHIHEIGLRLRCAPVVAFYQDIFDNDWRFAETNSPAAYIPFTQYKKIRFPALLQSKQWGTVSIQPTASPVSFIPDSSFWDEKAIVRLINNSIHEVCLQFLAFSTAERNGSRYSVLFDAMINAAKRGVQVKMIVSDWEKGSSGENDLKKLSETQNITIKYSNIPEWTGGYIPFARVEHCKFIVADGSVFWLGTSNAEKNYFHNSRNIGVIIENIKLAEILTKIFYKSWNSHYTETIQSGTTYAPREYGERPR